MKIVAQRKKESIAIVSDVTVGGAAVACERIYRGLIDVGQNATWLALNGGHDKGAIIANDWIPGRVLLAQRLLSHLSRSERWGRGSAVFNNATMAAWLRREPYSIVNLHNIHEGMAFGLLRCLRKDVPIVLTLHDMWSLTGYCCYSYKCPKYTEGCIGMCPQANCWGQMSTSPSKEWEVRQSFYRQNARRIVFVCPSQWLADCARARLPQDVDVEVIPYGIPLKVFRPLGEKRAIRQALGLPSEGSVILCGAQNVSDPRKGTRFLVEAVRRIGESRHNHLTVVAFGHKPEDNELPGDWVHTGTIHDEALLNLYYNAADMFVLPSLADNLPNTLLEATAAGTPCVTFDVGGCPEVVRNGETGFVARVGDTEHLKECIETLMDMDRERYREMAVACRNVALKEYDKKLQAERYVRVYEDIQRRVSACRSTSHAREIEAR